MKRPSKTARRVAGFAVLAVMAAAMIPGQAAAAAAGITFNLEIYSNCIRGVATPDSTLTFAWRDSADVLKVKSAVATSASGGWEYCSADPGIWVAPRDRIRVADGTSTRRYTVPNLTMDLHRDSDLITGTGPAGRTVRVCSTWSFFGDWETCHGVRIGQDGTWILDPHTGLFLFEVELRWRSPNDDRLALYERVPRVSVTVGKATVTGVTVPRAHVELFDGRKIAVADGNGTGSFRATFRNSLGTARPVAFGDHITGPSFAADEDWIVPKINGTAHAASDIVSGKCGDTGTADDFVAVRVRRNGILKSIAYDRTASDGTFAVDFRDPPIFADPVDIHSGDKIVIECFQQTGDSASWSFRAP